MRSSIAGWSGQVSTIPAPTFRLNRHGGCALPRSSPNLDARPRPRARPHSREPARAFMRPRPPTPSRTSAPTPTRLQTSRRREPARPRPRESRPPAVANQRAPETPSRMRRFYDSADPSARQRFYDSGSHPRCDFTILRTRGLHVTVLRFLDPFSKLRYCDSQ